jgi:hypothetical protein
MLRQCKFFVLVCRSLDVLGFDTVALPSSAQKRVDSGQLLEIPQVQNRRVLQTVNEELHLVSLQLRVFATILCFVGVSA